MSDQLAAAAAALGVPAPIVQRSAEARAKEVGANVEDILAAWAGGAPAPTTPAAPTPPATEARGEIETTAPQQEARAVTEAEAPEPEARGETEAPRPPLVVATAEPPVLVGRVERTGALVAGLLGLLVLSILLAVAAPAVPVAGNEVRSSRLPFSAAAQAGQHVYRAEACGSCHTQLVRNIVADVGLGPVTLPDTNQVPGYRRYGPDLAAVGSRLTDAAAIAAIVRGEGGHPVGSGLSDEELNNLVAYLLESR